MKVCYFRSAANVRFWLAGILLLITFGSHAQVTRDLRYVPSNHPNAHARHVLDIYRPQTPASQKLPLLIVIHGGSWLSGGKGGAPDWLRHLVLSGRYVLADLNYRFSTDAPFPAQVHDVKTAIRFLKENADRWNIDPEKVGLLGFSSGAHLAALVGASAGVEALEGSHLGSTQANSQVGAVVGVSGVYDFTTLAAQYASAGCPAAGTVGTPESPFSQLLGCTISACPESARLASPVSYVNSDEPPFLLLHGNKDCSAPFTQAMQLKERLEENNIPVTLNVYDQVGHDNTFFQSEPIRQLYQSFYDSAFYRSQPCQGQPTSVGFIPIPDLAGQTWNGWAGGLYPGGTNQMPEAHLNEGLRLAQSLQRRNASGQPDPAGKIVFMAVGMSNGQQEFDHWSQTTASTFESLNPHLVMVNAAQGGVDINKMIGVDNGTAADAQAHLAYIRQRLERQGVTPAQVQVIWIKQAERVPTGGLAHIDRLRDKFIQMLQMLKKEFPNLQMAYFSSRSYGGYNPPGRGTPEPYAYYQGWSVKRLIEAQITGSTALRYTGPDPVSPWIAWGPYLWADGLTPRSDGLTWACSDFVSDGVHPSETGLAKTTAMLQNFFTTDPTAARWFTDGSQTVTALAPDTDAVERLHAYPNSAPEQLIVEATYPLREVRIYNSAGVLCRTIKGEGTQLQVDTGSLRPGIYWLITDRGEAIRWVR